MSVSVLRMITDFLKDGTYGVNAQLDVMTSDGLYDAGDSQPVDISYINDETRDDEIAQLSPPEGTTKKSSLSVFILDEISLINLTAQGESPPASRDEEVLVTIRFHDARVETAAGNRDSYYYQRALLKCLREFNRTTATRTRNQISIEQITPNGRFQPFFRDDSTSRVGWVFTLSCRVRDLRP